MEAVKTVGLTKKYQGLLAVDHLDLSVRQGELFSLLGVNGAGKTTTIKMLTGLTKPTGGDAFLNGLSIVANTNEVKRLIGVSPQETAVAPNLTVKENLALMCGVHGFFKQKKTAKNSGASPAIRLRNYLRQKGGQIVGRLAAPAQYCHGAHRRASDSLS